MKLLIILLIVVIVIGGGYMIFKDSKPIEKSPADVTSDLPVPGETNTAEMVAESENVVTYTDSGYAPASLNIKEGDTVTFKNESSQNMWPASAKHPTHEVYPTTGGCLGSTFDACQGVPPGQMWSFKFEVKGDWKYHDHLTPKYFGSVVVE